MVILASYHLISDHHFNDIRCSVISNISAGNAFSEFWFLFGFGFFGQNTHIYHISRISDWFYVDKLE
ncbi:unnamed protein product [Clonostachys rhizophaga]|uniref:Uncharacterized protein n=1 Tax=Clonostachys rhizophaga TaxID=160324 RepID=A0A9N9YX46_9HYPO|nr:unnamed protein product [Clonostachys rhizophaga]